MLVLWDPRDASPRASSCPLATVGGEQLIRLPEAPALVCDGGVVVQANLAAARLTGRRVPELLLGLSLDCLLVDYGVDAELIRADGRAIPVRVVRWHDPGTTLLTVLLVDVSDLGCATNAWRDGAPTAERRMLEARVERSSRRFADLMAISPLGIGIFDDTDRLIDANDALCALLGYRLEMLRGMTIASLTHPDERTEPWCATRVDDGARDHPVRQRMLLRADGGAVCCELHLSMSEADDGQQFRLVVFAAAPAPPCPEPTPACPALMHGGSGAGARCRGDRRHG